MSILSTPLPQRKGMNRGTPIYFPQVEKVLLPVFKCGYTSSHSAYSRVGKVLGSFNDLIDYRDVEKVTMVRNPYARVVSLWTCQNNRDNLHKYSDSFEKFVENIELLLQNGFVDGHYNTLIANLTLQGEFQPNKVFKLESLKEMQDYLGIDAVFPKKNESKNKKPSYQSYYTPRTREIVERLYEKDIEMFNYTF